MKTSFYQYNFKKLTQLFSEHQLSLSHVSHLFNWHYKQKKTATCPAENISLKTKKFISENFSFNLPSIIETYQSSDQTIKFLIKMEDGLTVETVLLSFLNKYTICLSTQVGCAMKCSFCHTGKQGLKRNLKTEEIIGQYLCADAWLKNQRPNHAPIKNIVYMGQGEPLHNFDSVKTANEIFIDQHGFSIGIQKITVSTAGYLPGLLRWNQEMPKVNLALSLHSTNHLKRTQLIPLNQSYPLAEVLKCIDQIPLQRKQYIIYEYLMINNFNDQTADALALGELLQGKKAIINLIPFNPYPGSIYAPATNEKIKNFLKILEDYSLPAMIRKTKGDDILAACGQLHTKST